MPYSEWTIEKGTALDWNIDENGNPVITEWLPAWWTKMVLAQKDGNAAGGSSSTIDIRRHPTGIPKPSDMGWTTADEKNASVWKGPDVWRANWDQNQMDFHSAVIVGEANKAVVVKKDGFKHPALKGSA